MLFASEGRTAACPPRAEEFIVTVQMSLLRVRRGLKTPVRKQQASSRRTMQGRVPSERRLYFVAGSFQLPETVETATRFGQ